MEDVFREAIKKIREAGAMITADSSAAVMNKGWQDYVTQRDIEVSDFLFDALPKLLSGSVVISEERKDRPCVTDEYTWIVDPIDGTSNFIFGMQLSAVSVGLLHKKKPIFGAVYNPFTNELFHAKKGKGAFLNDTPIHVGEKEKLEDTIVLFETNPYSGRERTDTRDVIHSIFQKCVDYRVTGAAALDICYIAAGRGCAFVSKQLAPWDFAGGLAILLEAGGKASGWKGEALDFEGLQPVVASNGKVHEELLGLTAPFS